MEHLNEKSELEEYRDYIEDLNLYGKEFLHLPTAHWVKGENN